MRRRSVLAVAAGAAAVAGCSGEPRATAAVVREHQPGVVTAPPGFVTMVAVTGGGAVLGRLDERVGQVHEGRAAEVTVGAGASFFEGMPDARPKALSRMPSFPSDVLDPAWCHGDLLLQVGAGTAERARAVADDLVESAGAGTVWRIDGFRAENGATAGGLPSSRNLFGFREGAGNPDPRDESLMDRLVWAGDDEPAWAPGGTYQAVRLVRFATELWAREPVVRQEQVIGRRRSDGAPLGGGAEAATFDYGGDPDGLVTPLDAHIRRANPRTPEAERARILRRGFSYRRGGDEGIVFVAFQRDLDTGFAAVQRRLDGEALQRYVLPFGGGYYFVPPTIKALLAVTKR